MPELGLVTLSRGFCEREGAAPFWRGRRAHVILIGIGYSCVWGVFTRQPAPYKEFPDSLLRICKPPKILFQILYLNTSVWDEGPQLPKIKQLCDPNPTPDCKDGWTKPMAPKLCCTLNHPGSFSNRDALSSIPDQLR